MMTRFFLVIAPLLAGLAVAAGAFGSHGLRNSLDPQAIAIWETAAKYQMYQAIALLLVGFFSVQGSLPQSWLNGAGIAFVIGIVLFSGSLYALSLSGVKILGVITPLGGAAFIVGWICLAIAGWQFNPPD
ncbi:hypothetical protein NIES970_20910 [[Synechococcus] sp. NIES-970]|nr:DUF423 domain-containing protein [Picosynechococcus sp. NKBG15041c]BAW97145.1 hypothetical protein NIES970_20910 [[Synechococcus] sp. NIES-970]